MEEKKTFEQLYNLPCEGKVDKKDCGKGVVLSYLSWAYAWATLIEEDPNANYKVYERPDGRIYWDDGSTAWVKVSVTMFGKEVIEYLAIMDDTRANASMPLKSYTFKNRYGEEKTAEAVTTFDAIKAIQRALVKAIARFGIGLKLYAGEDLPTKDDGETPQPKQTIPSIDPKPQPAPANPQINPNAHAANAGVSAKVANADDKLKEQMAKLDPAQTLAVMDWCKKKYNKNPNELTDALQKAELAIKIASAKYKADKLIDDDNVPF